MKKKIQVIVFTMVFALVSQAQDTTITFTPQQILAFKKEAVQKVTIFCQYLGDLASSETSSDFKPQLKKNIIRLFVPGATMEARSKSKAKISSKPKPIPEYVEVVAGWDQKFEFHLLQFYKVRVDISHLKEKIVNGQKMYCGTFTFWQRFLPIKEKKEGNKYTEQDFNADGGDETQKTGEVCFQELTDGTGKSKWKIFLGDTKVDVVKPLGSSN